MLYTNGARIVWQPEKLVQRVRQTMEQRLREIGPEVQAQVQRNLSVPTAMAGPSDPGEYPHGVTFNLRESVYWKIVSDRKRLAMFVGASAKSADGFDYATYHEYVSGRSYLRRTLAEMWPTLQRQLAAPIPGL